MKRTSLLTALGAIVLLTSAVWWTVDSVRYGSPLFYSRDAKQITVSEVDPVFGMQVTTTKEIPGPYLGLLDLGFPFGAAPLMAFGVAAIALGYLSKRRMRTIGVAASALMLVTSVSFAATSLNNGRTGAKTVTLNDAVRKNEVKFVSKAPLENIEGVADAVTGTFKFDPSNTESTSGRIEVAVRSMRTGMSKRDAHMLGEDWLDAPKYPSLVYDIASLRDVRVETSAAGKSTITGTAIGTFTMHGVTKPLEASIKLTYILESDATKSRSKGDLVMIETSFMVPWRQFGVEGRKSFNDKVSSTIAVSASLFGSTAQ